MLGDCNVSLALGMIGCFVNFKNDYTSNMSSWEVENLTIMVLKVQQLVVEYSTTQFVGSITSLSEG